MNIIRSHFIEGEEVFDNGDIIKIFNPSNNEEISSITCADKNSLERQLLVLKKHSVNGNTILLLKELKFFLNSKIYWKKIRKN